jgi:hypothetical protein
VYAPTVTHDGKVTYDAPVATAEYGPARSEGGRSTHPADQHRKSRERPPTTAVPAIKRFVRNAQILCARSSCGSTPAARTASTWAVVSRRPLALLRDAPRRPRARSIRVAGRSDQHAAWRTASSSRGPRRESRTTTLRRTTRSVTSSVRSGGLMTADSSSRRHSARSR